MNLHPTTAAVGSSASGVIILLWLVKLLPPSWHVEMTPEVAAALVGVFGGVVGAIMRGVAARAARIIPLEIDPPAAPAAAPPVGAAQ